MIGQAWPYQIRKNDKLVKENLLGTIIKVNLPIYEYFLKENKLENHLKKQLGLIRPIIYSFRYMWLNEHKRQAQ